MSTTARRVSADCPSSRARGHALKPLCRQYDPRASLSSGGATRRQHTTLRWNHAACRARRRRGSGLRLIGNPYYPALLDVLIAQPYRLTNALARPQGCPCPESDPLAEARRPHPRERKTSKIAITAKTIKLKNLKT